MALNWFTFDEKTACAQFLGERISERLAEKKNQAILLLLSGGSALSVTEYIESATWQHITVMMLDDRFTPKEAHNNFCQLIKTDWYQKIQALGATCISSVITHEDTAEEKALALETALRTWGATHAHGTVIALFGMGADGHTAGIFPFPEDPNYYEHLFLSERLVVAYRASGKNEFEERITTTHTFHQTIDHTFVFVTGDEKKIALEKLAHNSFSLPELPAQIFHALPDVTLGTTLHL
jgi:6-phosphogluconolactonase/glucosamine-6-phosphate isomerase/deaminase